MSKESTNYTLSELPEVLTAKYISDYLHVTNRQVYRWMATAPEAGGLKSFSIGKVTRAYKSDFIQWLEQRTKQTENQHGGYRNHQKLFIL